MIVETIRGYEVLLTWDDDDKLWVSFVPALNWLSTFGETRAEALMYTQEAVEGYIETSVQEGIEIP
jgi:predicted RNase H-like HicB family nuclease